METPSDTLPVFVSALLAFAVVVAVRRREALALRWRPDRHVAVAVGTGLLAAGFSAAILLLPERSGAGRVLHFLCIYGVCGALLPWWYVTRVERSGAAGLGLTWRRWKTALALGVVCGAALFARVLALADFSGVGTSYLAIASYHLLVGGLFELFLYYGFIHLRLERAFGPLPAVVGSAAIYALWHLGTELPMHADPFQGLTLLFAVGLLYHAVFQITRNLLSIWPFFFYGGVWNDFALELGFPADVGEAPGWATAALMILVGAPLWCLRGRGSGDSAAPTAGQRVLPVRQ